MIIKLLYKHGSGKIIQALEDWDWTARGCPEPVVDSTPEEWNAAQGKENRVVDGKLISTPKQPQFGQLTLGYIAKLNSSYPAMNLLPTDTIKEAKAKMTDAGVSFEESAALLLFYRENL